MPSLKGTQTEQHVLASFAGESQARNRYDFAASVARKEGYRQIAEIFAETALQEQQHAKRFFKFLEGGDVEISATFPAGVIGTTVENLRAAAAGEEHEHGELYPHFAAVAREEGFETIAKAFDAIAIAEKQHGKRFTKLANNIDNGVVFKKDKSVTWRCINCGYTHEDAEAPDVCPACVHPKSHFELLAENW